MIDAGAPAASRRPHRRRGSVAALATAQLLLLANSAPAAEPCTATSRGWCVVRRIASEVPAGELGFRFGEPRDTDGDRVADIAAGARFALRGIHQDGMAAVWSGASGSRLRAWIGELRDGLFGHWVLPHPDIDGDGRADVIIAAPNAKVNEIARGVLLARSPHSGAELWRSEGDADQNLGWHLALAGDHDGDGRRDLFAGAPGREGGRAYLISGASGDRLRVFAPRRDEPSYGWWVESTGDVDGDGASDLAVGAHLTRRDDGAMVGAAYLHSSANGRILRDWQGPADRSGFGEVLAPLGDLDGDGINEIAIAAPRTNDRKRDHPGEVFVYSAATGKEVRRFTGRQPGELFGRMVAAAGDVDGDAVGDVAIGAPWHRNAAGERAGRVEIISGKTGTVIAELIGDTAGAWFGWHITRAPDPENQNRPALLISSLRHPINNIPGTGVIEWYVLK